MVATLGANATSYDDVNLQSSLGYFYRVRSFNDAGNGGASNTAQATTPQLVTITGLAGHDTYHVKRVGTQIHIFENTPAVGQPTYSSELAALGASLSINTLAGDDTLNVSANGQPSLGVNQLVFNSGSGSNALQLTEGAARIDSTVDVGSVLSSTVSGGAQLSTARLNQNGLALNGAGTKVTILPDGALANVLDSLSLDATSTLDLTNNDFVLRATAGTKDAIHSDVQAKIASAQNGVDTNFITNWNGPGITSSSARTNNVATGFDLVSLGMIRNSDIDVITGLPGAAYPSFGGVPVSPDDVLIKYTYLGDGNLDGLVSFDDYVGMDNAFFGLIPNLGWATGDINFDTAINFDDYTVVDQAFFFQGAPLAVGQAPPATAHAAHAFRDLSLAQAFTHGAAWPSISISDKPLQGRVAPKEAVALGKARHNHTDSVPLSSPLSSQPSTLSRSAPAPPPATSGTLPSSMFWAGGK